MFENGQRVRVKDNVESWPAEPGDVGTVQDNEPILDETIAAESWMYKVLIDNDIEAVWLNDYELEAVDGPD